MNDLDPRPVPPGTLHLLPVPIAEPTGASVLPASTCLAAQSLDCFLVENARSARRALKLLGHPGPLQALEIHEIPVLPKGGAAPAVLPAWQRPTSGPDSTSKGGAPLQEPPPVAGDDAQTLLLAPLLQPLLAGRSIGVLSEAGCPGIADPGARLAAWAQAHGIPVRAHVGPSSILLALMGSGLDGQRFSFHGYLPVDGVERARTVRQLEQVSARDAASQLFIETPYRNQALFSCLLESLQDDTRLCIATDLTGAQESLQTRRIADWRAWQADLPKLPTVFVLQAAAPKAPPPAPPAPRRRGNPSARHPHR